MNAPRDVTALDQDVWWVDPSNQMTRLEDLEPGYLQGTLEGLRVRAADIYTVRLAQLAGDMEGAREDTLEAMIDGAVRLQQMTPLEWLESTPLVRRMRELTRE